MLMLWAIFPIFAQIFYTTGGYIQNFLTDKALPPKRGGALVLTHLPAFLITIVILFSFFGRVVFVMPLWNAIGLVVAGSINIFGSIYYYKALQVGDAADVNIFSQLSPLIALGLGVAILGESVSTMQGIGLLLIMAAALLVVFGNANKKERRSPNLKVAVLTIIYAFFSILSDIIYAFAVKGFTADLMLLGRGMFFFEIGSALTVIVIFICSPSWRKALRTGFINSKNRNRNLLGSIGDNLTFMLGELIYKYGLLVVPVVAMMSAVGKVTSLFLSLFFTIFVGKIFPKFVHGKRLTKRMLANYLFAAVLIVVGIMIMN